MLELFLFILMLIAVPPIVLTGLGILSLLFAKLYPIVAIIAVLGIIIWMIYLAFDDY